MTPTSSKCFEIYGWKEAGVFTSCMGYYIPIINLLQASSEEFAFISVTVSGLQYSHPTSLLAS